MKLTIPILACAVLALAPLNSINAQTSPAKPGAAAAGKAPPKASTSASSGTGSNSFPASPAPASSPSATNARTEVYHVHFTKAAAGKATQLADNLKKPDPQDPFPGHTLVLRHQEGDSWDYAVIQHLGTKTTLEATRPAPSPGVRDLSDWHNDTYVNGPAWSEFAKAMGMDESGDKGKGSVYIISVYRPIAGHREDLEKNLSEPPATGDTVAGNVLMQHLEGGPWTFLTIARYNSWSDLATSESSSVADTAKGQGGWFRLREHASYHTDTVCDRVAP